MHQTKSSYAAAMMRRAFAEGKYAPGDRLQVAKLANELGLSLTPVREAFFELASAGLIDMHPHRGARVAEVSLGDLTEVYLLREALESLATRLAAEHVSDELAIALTASHERFAAAVEAGKRDSMRRLSDDFHHLIYDMAHAPMLSRMIGQVWASAPADTFKVITDRPLQSVEDHARILEALVLGDPAAAERCMRDHIQGSLSLIRAEKDRAISKSDASARGPAIGSTSLTEKGARSQRSATASLRQAGRADQRSSGF